MRNLFLVLVLLNLGFAAWQNWYAVPERPVRHGNEPDVPRIVLLDESAQEARDRSRASLPVAIRADQSAGSPLESCARIGPFADRAASEAAANLLAQQGYGVATRTAPGDIWVGRWVYADGFPTRADANNAVSALADAGIPETFVIADTDGSYLVSLGIFSEEARADQLAAQARGLGFSPIVVDRTRADDAVWLDVEGYRSVWSGNYHSPC
jgi:hypothetical protein